MFLFNEFRAEKVPVLLLSAGLLFSRARFALTLRRLAVRDCEKDYSLDTNTDSE